MQIDQVSAGAAEGAGGQAAGTATGMYYDNARFYDPVNGRFLNQDPLGYGAGDPDLYRFVGNDPTGATDPSGMEPNLGGGDVNANGGSSGSSDLMNYVGRTWSATAPDAGDNGQGFSSDASGTADDYQLMLSNGQVLPPYQPAPSPTPTGGSPTPFNLPTQGPDVLKMSDLEYINYDQSISGTAPYVPSVVGLTIEQAVTRTVGAGQAVLGTAGALASVSAATASVEVPPVAALFGVGAIPSVAFASDGLNKFLYGPDATPNPSVSDVIDAAGQWVGLPNGLGNFVQTAGQVSLVGTSAVQLGIGASNWLTAAVGANAAADSGVMGAAAESAATPQATAQAFYKAAGWSDERIASHLAGVDFSQPVEVVTIPKGTQVVQYQIPGNPTGNYFAPLGTSAESIGVNPAGRVANIYTTTSDVTVLRSTAASTASNPNLPASVRGAGGGIQYFAPNTSAFGQ